MTVRRFEASSYRIGMDEVSNGPFVLYRAYEAMKEERDALRAQLAGYLAGGLQRHPHDGEIRAAIDEAMSQSSVALAAVTRERDEARAELRHVRSVCAGATRRANIELAAARRDAKLGAAVREACAGVEDILDVAATEYAWTDGGDSVITIRYEQSEMLERIAEAIAADREEAADV